MVNDDVGRGLAELSTSIEMREVQVMADFGCQPTWIRHEDGGLDNVEPTKLGLPGELVRNLYYWRDEFDAAFDIAQPQDAGFSGAGEDANFLRRDQELAQEVSEILSQAVIYKGYGNERTQIDARHGQS